MVVKGTIKIEKIIFVFGIFPLKGVSKNPLPFLVL
jgi:hypothetical protein